MMASKHLNITIEGKVQGVFYREATKAVADQLGVKGCIKNMPGGEVYIEAEADESTMQLFLDWCNEGPDRADVTSVKTDEAQLKNYRNFEVMKK